MSTRSFRIVLSMMADLFVTALSAAGTQSTSGASEAVLWGIIVAGTIGFLVCVGLLMWSFWDESIEELETDMRQEREKALANLREEIGLGDRTLATIEDRLEHFLDFDNPPSGDSTLETRLDAIGSRIDDLHWALLQENPREAYRRRKGYDESSSDEGSEYLT